MHRDQPLAAGYGWRNAGVAPCLPGGYPAITLKDARNGIAGVFVDEDFDVRTLPVGLPGKAAGVARQVKSTGQESRPLTAWTLPPAAILKPGTYAVWISIGSRTGTPKIALPLDNDDGQRRYRLGEIRIVD
jgi:hypothetical protein